MLSSSWRLRLVRSGGAGPPAAGGAAVAPVARQVASNRAIPSPAPAGRRDGWFVMITSLPFLGRLPSAPSPVVSFASIAPRRIEHRADLGGQDLRRERVG